VAHNVQPESYPRVTHTAGSRSGTFCALCEAGLLPGAERIACRIGRGPKLPLTAGSPHCASSASCTPCDGIRGMAGTKLTMDASIGVGCRDPGAGHSDRRCPQKLGLVIWVTVHVASSTTRPL
jgi:hypothetical protein